MNVFHRRRKVVKPRACEFTQADLRQFNANFKKCMAKRGLESGKRAWIAGGTVS